MNCRVGYRFHPTDEELIDYFLKRKINGTLQCNDVSLIDICTYEPWDLPKYAAQGSIEDDQWYFFHKRELKNKNSSKSRYNRTTKTGHWKPTGKVRPIKARRSRTEIGVKRTLVFYKYEHNREIRTNWVIHEYEPKAFPSQQADLVLCKLKEKADDKAETSACREAESSHRGPSDVLPAEVSLSELLLQSIFPDTGANLNQSYTLQPHIQIDEGVSIDDLELSDDIFQNGSNGFMYPFEKTELQPHSGSDGFMYQFERTEQLDPNEMDVSFFDALSAETIGYDLVETASNAHTNLDHSSSAQAQSDSYLEDIADMDSSDFYGMSSQFGDSSLNSGYTGAKGYRQMQSVQSLTETLPPPNYKLQACVESLHLPSSRYEQSGATKHRERQDKEVEVKMAAGKSKIDQVKLSKPSESKAREAIKRGTGLNMPRASAEEKITLKTKRDQKMVTPKPKICLSINTETSMLYQRSAPVSVYIINISIGLVLFVAALRDLLILH